MYNLLVAFNPKAWTGEPHEMDLDRVWEHTAQPLAKHFETLDNATIEKLLQFPALFAYETQQKLPARIGTLTRIRHRNKKVRIEYKIDPAFPEILMEEILKHQWDFDVTDWEMNRSHWALKDV